jgi:uncharacterized protein YcbX
MLKISRLFIYPVKSLHGIEVNSAIVTDRGFRHDRRWMLVDENNRFLTLREHPQMTLLKVELKEYGLRITSVDISGTDLIIPFTANDDVHESVTIWNATVEARRVGKEADAWFSERLGIRCKLVFMPEHSMRPVDTTSGYAPAGKFTSFADAYPFMMLGEASINDLNRRLEIPVSIKRFRPNIVFSGGEPYQEDTIGEFTIGTVRFTGLENCSRCMVPNVDPETGIPNRDREPIKTLSGYRMHNKKIEFGRNLVHTGTGLIAKGDEIIIMHSHQH